MNGKERTGEKMRRAGSVLGKSFSAGLYVRLSREDGDKTESDSICNQKELLKEFIKKNENIKIYDYYTDDGYTGTDFNRPDFIRLIDDIKKQKINCVVVKDLSRFGRDYIDTGYYLERFFPDRHVRFIALNDGIDSLEIKYDLLLPVKNLFNEQYARDISDKVQSAIYTKQNSGDFIGAFACYGYKKDPGNHNKLTIDEYAANVVRKIFYLFITGAGKARIAKMLNEDHEVCPSEYKRLCGQNYSNGNRLPGTTYWTFSTIDRILKNQMYIGDMIQGKTYRPSLRGKAKAVTPEEWIRIDHTHEAIIEKDVWDKTQILLKVRTRQICFSQNISLFAGLLRCGGCGRAMTKNNNSKRIYYMCGSYKRYGVGACNGKSIRHDALEEILLSDINRIIRSVGDLSKIVRDVETEINLRKKRIAGDKGGNGSDTERIANRKRRLYEDYKDGLFSREEYFRIKREYDEQERFIGKKMKAVGKAMANASLFEKPWVKSLLQENRIAKLDREVLLEMIESVKIYSGNRIEITYFFPKEYDAVLNKHAAFAETPY